jgi:hypothetical protein
VGLAGNGISSAIKFGLGGRYSTLYPGDDIANDHVVVDVPRKVWSANSQRMLHFSK